jgi:predicted Zn-dependent protease
VRRGGMRAPEKLYHAVVRVDNATERMVRCRAAHPAQPTMPNPRIEQFKKMLAIDPNDAVMWFGLGKTYMEDGTYEEAAAALRDCIRVKPDYSAAYYALAQSLQKLDRREECLKVCDDGIAVSTKNGDAMVTKNLEAMKQALAGR